MNAPETEERAASVRRTVRRATVALGAAHMLQMGVSFLTLKILSATLGPERYGQYSAVLATYVLLGTLTDLGTGSVAVREMAQKPESARSILVATMRLRMLVGAFAAAIGFVVYALSHLPERTAGMLGAAFPLVQAWTSSRLYLQATIDQTRMTRAVVLGRILQLGIVFLAMKCRGDPLAAVGALVSSELAVAALLRREIGSLPRQSLDETALLARVIVLGALPLALSMLAGQVTNNFDVIFLRATRPLEETGLYGFAERPLAIIEQLPQIVLWSVFTIVAERAGKGDAAGVERAHRETLAALGLVAAPVAFGIALAGPQLVVLLFGQAYAGAGPPLRVLAVANALIFVSAPAGHTLIALGKTHVNLWTNLASVTLNVALNLWLVPEHGMMGAAYSWLASYVFLFVATHGWLRALGGPAPPFSSFARSAASGAIMFVGLRRVAWEWHPLAVVVAGACVYAIAVLATGAVRLDGRRLVIAS